MLEEEILCPEVGVEVYQGLPVSAKITVPIIFTGKLGVGPQWLGCHPACEQQSHQREPESRREDHHEGYLSRW